MSRRGLAASLALVLALVGGAWLATRSGAPDDPALVTPPPPAPRAALDPGAGAGREAAPGPPPLLAAPAAATDEPRSPVDLEALRRQLPDNLYWTLGAPTRDPEVAKARAADALRWNTAWGHIQAGEASDDEVRAYFEHQRRLHQDYLDFSARVLNDHGEALSERDRGLFELSASMHRDRLEELPRLEAEARARRAEQDRRRQAWEAAGRK